MMNKKNYFILFFSSLLLFSVNFIFQKTPGFMDSEYYFMGGKYLTMGQFDAPVVWNYLDNPTSLPHSLFTYWMPFPAIISMISMVIFNKETFLFGRLLFWIIAAGIPPLTLYFSFMIFKNKFSAWIAALLAIFSGFYLKFYTIPETVTIYIFLGGLYFLLINKLRNVTKLKSAIVLTACLGLITGFLHLTRVDGILFIGISIIAILLNVNYSKHLGTSKIPLLLGAISIYLVFYLLITGWWYVRNLELYSSLFSPASSKALWIANYEDTFIYPASKLGISYWIETGLPHKGLQIWEAFKSNLGNLIAVQSYVIGIPLVMISIRKIWKTRLMIFPVLYFLIIFTIMTFLFSEAGARGGYLHSVAAIQIFFWVLMADGLDKFIHWGIQRRGWTLKRSRIMFGSALIGFSLLLTSFIYFRDVIGLDLTNKTWDREAAEFIKLEKQIEQRAHNKQEVIMINNPVGFHVATDRWSVAIPNSSWKDLEEVIHKFNVKYIVLDHNLPAGLSNVNDWVSMIDLTEIYRLSSGKILYEIN